MPEYDHLIELIKTPQFYVASVHLQAFLASDTDRLYPADVVIPAGLLVSWTKALKFEVNKLDDVGSVLTFPDPSLAHPFLTLAIDALRPCYRNEDGDLEYGTGDADLLHAVVNLDQTTFGALYLRGFIVSYAENT